MKTQSLIVGGPLTQAIQDFMAYKHALGRRYFTEEKTLRLVDRYLAQQGVNEMTAITSEMLETFLVSRPRRQPRSYNHLLGVLRRFFDWLVLQEKLPQSPIRFLSCRRAVQRPPFVFDPAQVRRLLQIATDLPDYPSTPLRGPTYRMIFALLSGLGLRVGEVSRLHRRDVDLERQLLIIRETKFCKNRLVPFGPRMAELLAEYLCRCEQRRGWLQPDSPLFTFRKGRPVSPGSISQMFHHLLPHLQLHVPEGVFPPCVHCLRHSFAVNTLLHWYRSGNDPSKRLFHLSTFLGHVDPASTAVYLTITADLLREAGRRFEHFVAGARKEG